MTAYTFNPFRSGCSKCTFGTQFFVAANSLTAYFFPPKNLLPCLVSKKRQHFLFCHCITEFFFFFLRSNYDVYFPLYVAVYVSPCSSFSRLFQSIPSSLASGFAVLYFFVSIFQFFVLFSCTQLFATVQ